MSKRALRVKKNGASAIDCDTLDLREGSGTSIALTHDAASNSVRATFTSTGGGGSTPTGTGFRHVTADVEDATAKLVVDADVDAAAAIAQSKIANLTTDLAAKVDDSEVSTLPGVGLIPKTAAEGNLNGWVDEATTGAPGLLSAADKTKLDGIASGAEVNVNADWNAVAGDAQILNKPTLFTSDDNARVAVKKAGVAVGTRRGINLIEGSNVTLTVADDAGNEEVDVTITASTGSGSGVSASARCEFVEDCIGIAPSGIGGVIGWQVNVSGGQVQPSGNVLASATHPGIWELAVTSAGNYATLHAQDSVPPGTGADIELEMLINLPTLSDGTHRFLLNLGFGDAFNTTAWADGVYVEYDDSASANWRLVAVSGGVSSVSDSGVAVATGWTKLKIAIDEATSAQLYVNGSAAGSAISTNLPNAAGACGLYFRMRKTVGSALRLCAIDYIHLKSTFTAAR